MSERVAFESKLDVKRQPLMDDHRILGVVIVPAVYHLELAMAAGAEALGGKVALEDVIIHDALVLREEEDGRVVRVSVTPAGTGGAAWEIQTRPGNNPEGKWTLHSAGRVRLLTGEEQRNGPGAHDSLQVLRERCTQEMPKREFYRQMDERLITLGPRFQCIQRVLRNGRDVLLEVELPEPLVAELQDYQVHPVHLDSGYQLLANEGANKTTPYVPFSVNYLRYHGTSGRRVWVHLRRAEDEPGKETQGADLRMFDESGKLIAESLGMRHKRVPREQLQRATRNTLGDWVYEIQWASRPLSTSSSQVTTGKYVVFLDEAGTGANLVRVLSEGSGRVITVSRGTSYETNGAGRYRIDPQNPEHYQRVVEDLQKEQLAAIAFLWPLDATPFERTTPSSLEADHKLTCGSLLYFVQAMAKANLTRGARLWLATRNVQAVGKPRPRAIGAAALWGMGKVVGLEYPDFWGGQIDLDATPSEHEAALLQAEMNRGDGEDHIAYRDGQRNTARVVKTQVAKPSESIKLRGDATYFIAGGLTGLGLKTAEWMVQRGAKHVVLSGRRPPDEAAQLSMNQMNSKGANVQAVRCDITNGDDVRRVLTELRGKLPPLRGIVQSAGVLDDGVIAVQTWESFWKVLNPKVKGTWNLHSATVDQPLDFFIIYASVTSVLGWVAQPNYSAANSFQDMLAHSRRSLGMAAQSWNWGPFSEVGMAADVIARRGERLYHGKGVEIISPQAGMDMLDGMIAENRIQLGIHPIDWSKFLQAFPSGKEPRYLSELAKLARADAPRKQAQSAPAGATSLLADLGGISPDKRREVLKKFLTAEVCKVLGLSDSDHIDSEQPLSELGVDSVLAVELRTTLVKTMGRSVPATLLFDYPTVEQLSDYFVKDLSV